MADTPDARSRFFSPLRVIFALCFVLGALVLGQHYGVIDGLLIIIGWASLGCMWFLFYRGFMDRFFAKHHRAPREEELIPMLGVCLAFLLGAAWPVVLPWVSLYLRCR